MSPRYWLSLALVFLLAVPAAARVDALTGEPIPYPSPDVPNPASPPAAAVFDAGLELVHHLAEGSSKNVRMLPGDIAVWQNGAWLEAHDLSDPAAPVALSRYLLPAQPSDMKVVGDQLYLALRLSYGLMRLDYTDPAAPALVGHLPGYDLLSVDVAGNYAYCGRGTAGFIVIDLTDPANPAVIGSLATPGSANGTSYEDGILAVAQGASGVGFYDVSNPASPTSLASHASNGFCTFVQLRNGLAYLADAAGLRIIDASTPGAPVLLGAFEAAGGSCYELAFAPASNHVYLAGLGGVFKLDVSNPAAPTVAASAAIANGFSCNGSPGRVVAAARFSGLHVLSESFEPAAQIPNAGFSMKLEFDGTTLYVADLAGGVRLWDLSNPAAPVFLAKVDTHPNCQNLAVEADILYAVNSNNTGAGLVMTDVADPAAPAPLSVFDTANATMDVAVSGTLAVLANGFGGLRTVDVGNPLAPALLGDLALGSNIFGVAVQNQIAYVASFGGGMLAVDVADPAAMAILSQQPWGFLNAIDVTGQIAWVADGQAGLRIVDISDPANLVTLATLATASQARDVVRSRSFTPFVYVADDFYGLRQIDVSDPANPLLFGSYPSSDRGVGVAENGPFVVLAAGETGVYIYRNPSVVPVLAGTLAAAYDRGLVTLDLWFSVPDLDRLSVTRTTADPAETRVFAALELRAGRQGDSSRLSLRDQDRVSFPRTYRLEYTEANGDKTLLDEIRVTPVLPMQPELAAAPNPFNPRLEVSYVLPQAQTIRLDVYDARGRFVRNLVHAEAPAGPGAVVWHGDDAAGRAAGSGVYHVRLQTGETVTTRSVTLVR